MEKRGISRGVPRSELICPKDFMGSWDIEALEATRQNPANEGEILDNIASKMSISSDTVRELSEVCGKNTLFTGFEPKNRMNLLQMKETPSHVDLECVKYQMEQRSLRQKYPKIERAAFRKMKYNSLDEYMAVAPPTDSSVLLEPEFTVRQPNVILTVQITKCLVQGDSSCKVQGSETFLVLGSQTLAELRDKISCSSDAIVPGDYSAMPDLDPDTLQKAGDIYKSSCFFIENVFYNDRRLQDNKDYSKPLISWAEKHMPNVEMKTAEMSSVTFNDLKIRLGHYYLFLHQGNCEHAVLFTDLRLFSATDIQDVRLYPILSVHRIKNRAICQGCSKLTARWAVQDSPLIPTDPCFLCNLCFKTLMYTKQGQKTSNFRAYHFLDFYAR